MSGFENQKFIYFDNASTTQLDPEVLESMKPFLKNYIGNPSSIHNFGRKAKVIIEDSRQKISNILGCKKDEIYFTSGGTESNNWILKSIVNRHSIKNIVTSKLEHKSILETIKNLDCNIYFINNDHNGNLDLQHLETILNKIKNSLVSVMYINNEIGNINDIKKIGFTSKKYNHFFHSDCAQSIGHKLFDLKNQNIDSISAGAHKFHGPHGIGFLYLNSDYVLDPLIFGGEQETGHRAGTENTPSIVGMTKAIEIAHRDFEKNENKLKQIKLYAIEKLKQQIPNIIFNGNCDNFEKSSNSILNITLPTDKPNDLIIQLLDIKNICISSGSACNSGVESESYVIKELYQKHLHNNYIRVSFSKNNNLEEIDSLVFNIFDILN